MNLTTKRIGGKIRDYLLANKETIAVAESVTSGLLQFMLSTLTDAEQFYQGGITTYNIGQKYRHLHVEPIHAKSCNCVSAIVAEQMAMNVCDLFNSDWGIGITGYASPVPESGKALFCYYSICYKAQIKTAGKIVTKKMAPVKVQEKFVTDILSVFVTLLDKINAT